MAIQLRAVSTVVSTATSPNTITAPAGLTAGDLILLHYGHTADRAPTVPSGFTLIAATQSTGIYRIEIYAKIATGSEPSTYSVSWSSSGTCGLGMIAWYSDAGRTLTIDDASVAVTAGTRVWSAVAPTHSNTVLNNFGTFGFNAGSTPPGGSSEQYDVGSTVRMYLMTEALSSSGSTGTRTATGAGGGTARLASVAVAELLPPAAPSGLTATVISDSEIDLSWTDNSSNETGFVLDRSPDNATWSTITSPSANATSYNNTGLSEHTLYYYRIKATNADGDSSYSSTSATTAIKAPSGLSASAVSDTRIDLSWTDNSGVETGYKVERSPNGSTSWTEIATPAANATSYSNTGLTPGTTYYYRVRANVSSDNSAYSSTANATTTAPAPTGVSAVVAGSTQINLSWTDTATGETGFSIERSLDGSTGWTEITVTAANATSYSDTGLSPLTTYYYRIRTVSGIVYSSYSSIVHAATTATIGRVVKIKFWADWDRNDVYSEEGSVMNASGQIRLAAPLTSVIANRSIVDQCSITLQNESQRYSSLLTTAVNYATIGNGKAYHIPMYLEVSVDNGANYYRVFTGAIKNYVEDSVTGRNAGTITLDCRSREEEVLNHKISTLASEMETETRNGDNESIILSLWLQEAGLDAGDFQLDDGLYTIPWPYLADESAIEQGWDIAAACAGRMYMRHYDGKFIYQNNQHWALQSSVTTYTRADYASLKIKYPDQELFKTVIANYTTYTLQPSDTIFTLESPLTVAPGATLVHEVEIDNPAMSAVTLSYTATTTGGRNITADVAITLTSYAKRLSFSIVNSNTVSPALIRLLAVTGQEVQSNNEEKVTLTSADAFWDNVAEKKRTISNRYISSQAQAGGVAAIALAAGETPLLQFELTNALGNPQLAVGDLITVSDSKVMSAARDAFVTAISWRFGPAGFMQTIEAIEAAQLFPYLGATPAYFVLGTNKLGSSDALKARMFY